MFCRITRSVRRACATSQGSFPRSSETRTTSADSMATSLPRAPWRCRGSSGPAPARRSRRRHHRDGAVAREELLDGEHLLVRQQLGPHLVDARQVADRARRRGVVARQQDQPADARGTEARSASAAFGGRDPRSRPGRTRGWRRPRRRRCGRDGQASRRRCTSGSPRPAPRGSGGTRARAPRVDPRVAPLPWRMRSPRRASRSAPSRPRARGSPGRAGGRSGPPWRAGTGAPPRVPSRGRPPRPWASLRQGPRLVEGDRVEAGRPLQMLAALTRIPWRAAAARPRTMLTGVEMTSAQDRRSRAAPGVVEDASSPAEERGGTRRARSARRGRPACRRARTGPPIARRRSGATALPHHPGDARERRVPARFVVRISNDASR